MNRLVLAVAAFAFAAPCLGYKMELSAAQKQRIKLENAMLGVNQGLQQLELLIQQKSIDALNKAIGINDTVGYDEEAMVQHMVDTLNGMITDHRDGNEWDEEADIAAQEQLLQGILDTARNGANWDEQADLEAMTEALDDLVAENDAHISEHNPIALSPLNGTHAAKAALQQMIDDYQVSVESYNSKMDDATDQMIEDLKAANGISLLVRELSIQSAQVQDQLRAEGRIR